MKKRLLVAAIAAAMCWVAPIQAGGDIIEQVLVKVNGDIISKTELEGRQVAALRQKMNGQVDQDALKNDAQLKKLLAEITPQVLVNAVDELLLLQHGRELGYKMSDEQFRQIVNN